MFDRNAHSTSSASETDKLVLAIAFGIAFGYAASLAAMFMHHLWILDGGGRPILDDFVVFWAAGHAASHGAALAVYDPRHLHAVESALIGRDFAGWLVWSYPPVFLLVAASLAAAPFSLAFAAWCAGSLAFYAGIVAAIAKRKAAFVVACAMPWVLRVLMIGQNGLFTAGLVGLALQRLEERPMIAGLALGLLSFKPQFGILFPIALAAGGYWRAFGWAAFGALAWNGLAMALFGWGTFGAFLHVLSATAGTHLAHDAIGWSKLQSAYGVARFLGAPGAVAWTAQGIASASAATAIFWCWRSPLPYPLKAALLSACVALATPYVFVDDLPVLAVALAFLFRDRGFDRLELGLLAAVMPCLCASIGLAVPSAFLVSLAIAGIAARRCYSAAPRMRIRPSWATEATSLPSSE